VEWITIRGGIKYIITFQTIPGESPSLSHSLTSMINSWHWNPVGS
jgi:hypothetical protein